ncbi:MAG: cytidine deaminase [Alphaproteobacteria bacterium]|nr:cytidine deaminase [Alphaproteobacteria bacterium]
MSDQATLAAMLAQALAARANAHAPYSGFKVGACLRGESGRLFWGCNVENAAYPQGQCAEASAIGALVAAGDRRILECVVVAEGPDLVTPCGGCRQRLREFARDDMPVHLGDSKGLRRTVTLGELLPLSFGPDHLKK